MGMTNPTHGTKGKLHMNKRGFLKYITTVAVTAGTAAGTFYAAAVKGCRTSHEEPEEPGGVRRLRPGDPIPQLFKARVPVPGYRPGEQIGFEILNLNWAHPFWQHAVPVDGYAVCEFAVGCVTDIGQVYKITGYRLPGNLNIPDGELKGGLECGITFFGPSYHRRV